MTFDHEFGVSGYKRQFAPQRGYHMTRLGVGIIGLGEVAQLMHLPVLTRLADLFSVTAVTDVSPSVAKRVGERWHVPNVHPERRGAGFRSRGRRRVRAQPRPAPLRPCDPRASRRQARLRREAGLPHPRRRRAPRRNRARRQPGGDGRLHAPLRARLPGREGPSPRPGTARPMSGSSTSSARGRGSSARPATSSAPTATSRRRRRRRAAGSARR